MYQGQRCPKLECHFRLHDICKQNFFRVQKSTQCPLCRTDWTNNQTFVGERAAASTNNQSQGRRWGGSTSSSKKKSRTAERGANEALDGEDREEEHGSEENDWDIHLFLFCSICLPAGQLLGASLEPGGWEWPYQNGWSSRTWNRWIPRGLLMAPSWLSHGILRVPFTDRNCLFLLARWLWTNQGGSQHFWYLTLAYQQASITQALSQRCRTIGNFVLIWMAIHCVPCSLLRDFGSPADAGSLSYPAFWEAMKSEDGGCDWQRLPSQIPRGRWGPKVVFVMLVLCTVPRCTRRRSSRFLRNGPFPCSTPHVNPTLYSYFMRTMLSIDHWPYNSSDLNSVGAIPVCIAVAMPLIPLLRYYYDSVRPVGRWAGLALQYVRDGWKQWNKYGGE